MPTEDDDPTRPMSGPPRLAEKLLRLALGGSPHNMRGYTIEGDLRQEFEEHAAAWGAVRLRLWYWAQVIELGSRYAWFRARNAFKRPPSTVSAAGTDPTIVIPPNLTKEEATSTCPIPTRWASGFVSV